MLAEREAIEKRYEPIGVRRRAANGILPLQLIFPVNIGFALSKFQ